MTIYFDKRAFEEQEKEAAAQSEVIKKEEEKQEAMRAAAGVVAVFVKPVILMLLWNWLMPSLFGLVTIGYWTAMGLYLMSRILFGKYE